MINKLVKNIDASISVAIVTRNRSALLYSCLTSLSRQTVYPGELLVIDNASTDETKKVALSFAKNLPIRYIYEPKVGIPYARNRALREAKGEILAFTDDDCEATPTWIEEMIKAHRKYPKAAAIQGKSISKPEKKILIIFWQTIYDLWFKTNLSRNKFLYILDTKNVSFKLPILQSLKLYFNEQFQRGSDVDMAKELLHKNQIIMYDPKTIVFHRERRNIIAFLWQRYQVGKTQAMLEFKWIGCFPKASPERNQLYAATINAMELRQAPTARFALKVFKRIYKYIFQLGYMSMKNSKFFKTIKPVAAIEENVSVAIVTRNRSALLYGCLTSLSRQTVYPGELLVIDNASTDETKKVALSFAKNLPIRYIYEPKVGIPYARNRALREAKGEILAFTDDDCEATPTWIEEMIKAHRKYPKAAAIQGKLEILNSKSIIGSLSQRNYDSWFSRYLMHGNRVFTLDTANASFDRRRLVKLGISFDANFSRFYCGEDTDIAYQILSKKQNIMYAPSSLVLFRVRTRLSDFLNRRFRVGAAYRVILYKWSSLASIIKHRNKNVRLTHSEPVLNWLRRPLLVLTNALSLRAHQFGQIIEEIRIFYAQLLYGGMVLNKRKKEALLLAIHAISMCRGYSFPFFLKIMGERGLYLLVISFFLKTIDQQLLKTLILERKNRSSEKINSSISVAIVTRNRSALLYSCLTSLSRQTVYPGELLVIDNASTDETKKVALSFAKNLPIRYIYEPKVGIPYARNRALREAKGEILAFTDDDCEATPTWIEEMIKAHRKYPKAAAIQGKIKSLKRASALLATAWEIFYNLWFKKNIINNDSLTVLEMKNFSIKRSILKRLSITFDCISSQQAGIDLAKQILKKRSQIVYVPQVYVYHKGQNKISNFIMQALIVDTPQAKFEFKWSGISSSSITVAVVTRSRSKQLEQCLFSLVRQTLLPLEVLVIDNASTDETKKVALSFAKNLPIRYIYEPKVGIPYARNRALREAKGEILAFTDDDCEATPTWIEEMIKAHRKYPKITAILGGVVNIPHESIFATIVRFNYQTWIKDNLIGDRNLYWDIVNGKTKKFPEILVCDTKNISLKIDNIHKANLTFNEELMRGSDSEFGREILSNDLHILFYPKARIYHHERDNLKDFLQQAFYQGESLGRRGALWPMEYHSPRKKVTSRLVAFIYFCFVNRFYLKLPVLVVYFLIHRSSRQRGMDSGKMSDKTLQLSL